MLIGIGDEGGYIVFEEWVMQVLEVFKVYGGMCEVGMVIQMQVGGQMNYLILNGVSEEGEIVLENMLVIDVDLDFGIKVLNVYKFSFKVIIVLIELIQDFGVDIEVFVCGCIEQCLGWIINCLFIVGIGMNQFIGIVIVFVVGKVGVIFVIVVVIYNDLLDLQYFVDLVYWNGNDCWMMYDSGVKMICKLVDNEGCLLYLFSYDSGICGGVLVELMGCLLIIN